MLDHSKASWMQTYTGRQFWPLSPDPAQVDIEDIAHSLAMLCRYNGHTTAFYSVAEHCCLLHDIVPFEHRKWALLHDASEAYLSDLPRPIKGAVGGYREAEGRVMNAIAARFGLVGDQPECVSILDKQMLRDEMAQAMSLPPAVWDIPDKPAGVELMFWPPMAAKREFLKRFYALEG